MSAESLQPAYRQVALTSIRHRMNEAKQMLKTAPLDLREKALLANLIDCVDAAVEECQSSAPGLDVAVNSTAA